MLKILIFGASGMIGHMISIYLNSLNKYQIINVVHSYKLSPHDITADVENKEMINAIINDNTPDIIINCLGILIKASEENPDKAIYLNSFFPHYLEKLGKGKNMKIIHLSTDCVFSGQKGNYSETDLKDGKGFYAQSRALGEIINSKDLTFRTSTIGPELKQDGTGLFHWFMNQKGIIKGYNNTFWTGVTTLELAKAIDAAIVQNIIGLYHLVPSIKISKYELLNLIKKVWNKNDIEILKDDTVFCDKSLINNRKDFNFIVNNYEIMLNELYDFMKVHSNYYKNY